MANLEQAHDTIEQLIRELVVRPEAVNVTIVGRPPLLTFQIQVAPEDISLVIGKGGRTARSIRIIANTLAQKLGMTFSVNIVAKQDPK